MAAVYDDSGRADQTYGNSGPGAKLNIISLVGLIFGLLLIINRLFWRWKKGTPGIDDLIIVLAWMTLLVLGVITFMAVDYGYGRTNSSLTRMEASNALRMFYLYQIFYKLTLNLSKLSILTLYLRVFDTKDWFGNITKFLIFIVATYTTSIILTNILICRPISTYWSTSDAVPNSEGHSAGSCINILAYWYASSFYNILSETLMLLSVLIRIWTLPSHSHPPILQLRQKINLTIVLGLGVFTVITAILRMTTLNQGSMATDRTGGTLTSTTWSSVEAGLGLAVANLPMVRQLLRWKGWCGGRWFRSSAEKSRSQSRSRSRSLGVQQQRVWGEETGAVAAGGYTLASGGAAQQSPFLTASSTGRNSRDRPRPLSSAIQSPDLSAQQYDSEAQAMNDITGNQHDHDDDTICEVHTPDSDHLTNSTPLPQPISLQTPPRQIGIPTPITITNEKPPSSPSIKSIMDNYINSAYGYHDHDHDHDVDGNNTPTPSITSTSTLRRSPTEPIPMARISTEPSLRSNVSASCRRGNGTSLTASTTASSTASSSSSSALGSPCFGGGHERGHGHGHGHEHGEWKGVEKGEGSGGEEQMRVRG